MINKEVRNNGIHQLCIIWTTLLYLTTGLNLSAQDAVIRYSDSLLYNAHKAPTTELKIEKLLNISIFWIDYDTVKAYQYLEKARRLMGKSPTDYQKGLYHLYHANILMDFESQKAKAEFSTADSLLASNTTTKSYRYRSKLWNNYGV